MPEATIDVAGFAGLRRGIDAAESRVRATELRIAAARDERERLARAGAPADRLAAAEARVADLLTEHGTRLDERDARIGDLADLARDTVGRRDPAQFVATLGGGTPIALLPVRLETRYFADGTELRIRIYPDQVHLDAHEPELTDAEVAAGERYWRARWQADAAARRAAWQEIAGTLEPRRARWVVEQATPANLPDEPTPGARPDFPGPPRKGGPWTRAVQARALPDRWLAIGYRDGAELFRRWSGPVPDALATTPTPDPAVDPDEEVPIAPGELPGDDPMRWAVGYDAALAAGMAITVTDAQLPAGRSLAAGLDRLVVIGVDWTLAPGDAAKRLAALLDGHRVSDGLGFAAHGTPTNNTGATRSGVSTARSALIDELDPDAVLAAPPDDAAGRRLAAALGLPADVFDPVPRSGLLEARTASRLAEVLWAATLGHYLDDLLAPLVDGDTAGLTRDHVTRWLHPGGPYATLRVGRQPYGVLPVVAPGRYVPERPDGFEHRLATLLGQLRPVWTEAVNRVPRVGRSSDVDTDLLDLLQRNPLAMVARFRQVFGPASVADTSGFADHAEAQAWLWGLWRRYLGWPTAPELALYTTDPKDHPLPVPWVQAGPPGQGPSAPNYLAELAAVARAPGGRDRLAAMTDADTLLQALVAHAAAEELDRAFADVVLEHLGRQPQIALSAKALRTQELYGVIAAPSGPVPTERLERRSVGVSTPRQMAHLVIPDVTGALTVDGFVTDLVVSQPERPEVRTLATFLAALDELAGRPAAEIDRAFRGFLDATSHRLDAWATSLATRRLDAVRQDRPAGVHLGGYGWVEDLRPDRTPDSLGYVHAPSLPHAATAAILRSGHLSHRDAEHETLDIQLSSDRVQRALPVIEGAAAGQPLTALLGYRVERGLRESADRLTRYILPARRFTPLRPSGSPAGPGPQEAIAARDVVDGVALLERWRDDRGAVLAGLGVASADRAPVATVLDDVATTYDAVSDLLVAEAVHQTVLGNYERAGAALAAVDRQERPPDPEVVRTPRTGVVYTQKVLVAVGTGPARAPWRAARDARSDAAPALNAWAASLLPDPADIVFWGELTSPGGNGAAPVTTPRSATAADLGLSPLGLVLATASGAAGQPSELETRVAAALVAGVTLADDDRLELLDGRPAGAQPSAAVGVEVNLGAFRALLGWMRELLGNARPLVAEDLAPPGGDRQTGVHVAGLAVAGDTAVAALATAEAEIAAVAGDEAATAAALRRALGTAAALGVADAVPQAATGGSAAIRAALRAQLGPTGDELARRRSRVDGLGTLPAPVDGTLPTEAMVVGYHRDRLRAVFGDGFPVVPAVRLAGTAADVPGLAASLADAPALTAGDGLAPRLWLDRMATVRPGVDRLARVLQAAELLGAGGPGRTAEVPVAQLPHAPGQRWLALPFGPEGPAGAQLAIALHAAAGADPVRPIVGLVCDEWVETIPQEAETTGLTFHYDAPAARAPQAVLLAVPPQLAMGAWDLDTLVDTVLEAAELTRLRGVTPKDLRWVAGALPMVYLPQNFTGDRPSVDLGRLLGKYAAEIKHAEIVGKGWSL
jgi:hypothetical protein